jgi:hypothetical protein
VLKTENATSDAAGGAGRDGRRPAPRRGVAIPAARHGWEALPASNVFGLLWIVAGIGLRIAVPVAVRALRPPAPAREGLVDSWFVRVLKPYLKYAIASIVL